jgi:hypothetical protein
VRFASEITAPVTVEVLDVEAPSRGRFGDAPERCYPASSALVEIAVRLGGVDITAALSAELLEALAAEALERLEP